MENLWKVWLAVAGILTTVYFLMPTNPGTRLVLFTGVGLLAVLAVVVGALKVQPAPRLAWMWMAAGLASFVTADVIYYLLERQGPPAFPSLADVFYLAMYALLTVGLVAMTPRRPGTSFIEAGVVGVALFCALWFLYISEMLSFGSTGLPLIVQLAYPAMGVLVAIAATRLIATTGFKHLPTVFVVVGIMSLTIADTSYNVYLNRGTFRPGLFIDFLWASFWALVGAAALYPTQPASQRVVDADTPSPTAREIAAVL